MDWLQRSLRALRAAVSTPAEAKKRVRLGIDRLEDRTTPSATGVISGGVFFDNNADSVQQNVDFDMPGVTVTLTGTSQLGNAVSASTTTDSKGAFTFFKLEAGQYQVTANQDKFNTAVGGVGNLGGVAAGAVVKTIEISQGSTEGNLRFGLPGLKPDPKKISLRLFMTDAIGTDEKRAFAFRDIISSAGTGQSSVDKASIPSTMPLVGTSSIEGDVTDAGGIGIANVTVVLSGVTSTGIPTLGSATTDSAGHYKFNKIASASYFVNVVVPSGFRAGGAAVGNRGGSAPRADQLAPSVVDNNIAFTGYNFTLVPFSGPLDAGLANDVAGGTLGTSLDGITSDPSIRGQIADPATFSTLQARFVGVTNGYVDINGAVLPDGTFVLNRQMLRDVFGGGIASGSYSVEVRALSADGAALSKTVSFSLVTTGPSFLSAFANQKFSTAAPNTVMLLSGAFTDPNLTNSSVTFNIMKGTTPLVIKANLYDKDAPLQVANFLNYIDRFNANGGTIFHRSDIQDAFKILQAGGYTFNDATNTVNSHITSDPTVRAEVSADRPNTRGTLGAARTNAIDSATGEFFFNLDDVNAKAFDVTNGGGYTVFGKVESDADLAVLDELARVPTSATAVSLPGSTSTLQFPLVDGQTLDENNILRITQVVVNNRSNELTYSVTSSDPSIVSVSTAGFQGNQLTLDYVGGGTATITVTATDSQGNSAVTSFVVEVAA